VPDCAKKPASAGFFRDGCLLAAIYTDTVPAIGGSRLMNFMATLCENRALANYEIPG
jgi:hypothetical protein